MILKAVNEFFNLGIILCLFIHVNFLENKKLRNRKYLFQKFVQTQLVVYIYW